MYPPGALDCTQTIEILFKKIGYPWHDKLYNNNKETFLETFSRFGTSNRDDNKSKL